MGSFLLVISKPGDKGGINKSTGNQDAARPHQNKWVSFHFAEHQQRNRLLLNIVSYPDDSSTEAAIVQQEQCARANTNAGATIHHQQMEAPRTYQR